MSPRILSPDEARPIKRGRPRRWLPVIEHCMKKLGKSHLYTFKELNEKGELAEVMNRIRGGLWHASRQLGCSVSCLLGEDEQSVIISVEKL